MYYDVDLDLEDIECRLYSQIYHSNTENEDANITSGSNIFFPVYSKIENRSNRYFSKTAADHSIFIPLEEQNTNNSEKTCSLVHNSISVGPNSTDINSDGNFTSSFQNITVNQYTAPLIINPELNDGLNPGTFFVPWAVKHKTLLDKKLTKSQKKAARRRRIKEREKQNCNIGNPIDNVQPNKATHIIYISDDSDSECLVASEMCKKNINTKEKPKDIVENITESDDDIIYIPPPPVEIINVDIDNEEDKTDTIEVVNSDQNKLTSPSNNSNAKPSNPTEFNNSESCTANDFLDNSGEGETSATKFNFSLHGSDFTIVDGFARPANPIDYCETESSCSTNDFNKENNSVKTIVFNEVDFPKEDIFSDKNLESFGTYITPKRSTIKKPRLASKLPKPTAQTFSADEESLSSSESDYESGININTKADEEHRKLPTLSPMQCAMTIISNTKGKKNRSVKKSCCNSKSQESTSSKKDSAKRKSNTLDSTDYDSDISAEPELAKKVTKKKKKICPTKGNSVEESANSVTNTDVDNDVSSTEEETVANMPEKHTRKKIKNSAEKNPDKKKDMKNKNEASTHMDDANSENCSDSISGTENMNTSWKKRKKNSTNFSKYEGDRTPTLNSKETIVGKVKRKKKKSLSTENPVNDTSLTELDQSRTGIEDIGNKNIENENISVDMATNELQNKEKSITSTGQSENKIDKAMPEHNLQNIEESSSEIFHDSLASTSVNVSQDNVDDNEIIVFDEPVSHKSNKNLEDCIEIIESSDSDCDFTDLADVGPNIQLANCSFNSTNMTDNDKSNSGNVCFKNKYVCEDYSKFDVGHIQSTQSDDPQDWKILAKDRITYLNPRANKGPRCNRCRHFGHLAVHCTEKPDPPSCTLCGFSDHQEPRCPHKRCTQCGNEGDYSTTFCWKCVKFRNLVCRICNMKGHISKYCPDLWRRYHLTTEEGPIVVSEHPQLKPRDQLWCSGCSKQGHLEHECNYYNREYPPTNPRISSYEDVLNQENKNKTPSPPPPPVWITPEQNNSYENVSFPNFPSTSQNIPYNAPVLRLPLPLPLIPQVPSLNPLFSVPTMMGQDGLLGPAPNIFHSNFPPVSTRVLNPFSVLIRHDRELNKNMTLDQMRSDYLKNNSDIEYSYSYERENGRFICPRKIKLSVDALLESNQRKLKQFIMSMPAHVVKKFLSEELEKLDNTVSQSDPRYLRRKMLKYDKLLQRKRGLNCSVVKEKIFWDQILNMFIFGVHKLKAGELYIDILRKCLLEPRQSNFDSVKRKSLLNAYNYIFDGTRHNGVNYYMIIQRLIEKYNERN